MADATDRLESALARITPNQKFSAWAGANGASQVTVDPEDIRALIAERDALWQSLRQIDKKRRHGFTPGPWNVAHDGSDAMVEIHAVSEEGFEQPIGAVYDTANGALVAAAPELYDALSALVAAEWTKVNLTAITNQHRERLERARVVLSKVQS
jgi:FMN phosphatase YigB (HAD superfamily)